MRNIARFRLFRKQILTRPRICHMKTSIFFAVTLVFASCSTSIPERPAGFREPLALARQVVVVRTATWDTLGGTLEAFERERSSDAWKPVRRPLAITVGSAGLGWGRGLHGSALSAGPVKREGDRRAPAGAFSLSAVYGYASADAVEGLSMPYIPLDSTTVCVDDPTSRYYNMIVDRHNVVEKDWRSAERMRSTGPWYRWGVVVDHNAEPRIPGDGSCIFLHVWGYPSEPTTGCTSFTEEDLVALLKWLRPSEHPVLVQLPEVEYQRLRDGWQLP